MLSGCKFFRNIIVTNLETSGERIASASLCIQNWFLFSPLLLKVYRRNEIPLPLSRKMQERRLLFRAREERITNLRLSENSSFLPDRETERATKRERRDVASKINNASGRILGATFPTIFFRDYRARTSPSLACKRSRTRRRFL